MSDPVSIAPGVDVGGERPLLLAGPCVLESAEAALQIGARLVEICADLDIGLVFKGSFDKANRTRHDAPRGPGLVDGLAMLSRVASELELPVCTDVHDVTQVAAVAEVADVLQIPAFLCRQTDLLVAAGASGRAINLKKGQFMAPEQMGHAVQKVSSAQPKGSRVLLTERGTCFGHNDLVVDYRGLPELRRHAPLLFDATHAAQLPGAAETGSGGRRTIVPTLARAAAAAGVDGFFLEVHPDPARSASDAATIWPLAQLHPLLSSLVSIWRLCRQLHGQP
jgi:2-dehydro-3-deoxyphosphooctonate aldolase (KDO 8-P synthase)